MSGQVPKLGVKILETKSAEINAALVIHLVTPVSRQAFRRNASPKTGGKRSICEK